MASKYENKEKIICGLTYNSHQYGFEYEGAKYKKLRTTTVIDNIIYEYWTSTQTWKNASENKNSSFNKDGWRFPKYFKAIGTIKEVGEKVIETFGKIKKDVEKSLLPVVYNPIRKNFIGETDNESMEYMTIKFGVCETKKEVSRVYKQFAKYYHPDFLGRDLFPHEKIIYQWLKDGKEMIMMNIEQADEFINSIWED